MYKDTSGPGHPTITRSRPLFRMALPALLLAGLAFVGSACGGGGKSPGVASGSSAAPAASSGTNSRSNYQSGLTYSACMRSHGKPDFPDPKPGGGVPMIADPNDPQLQAAEKACAHLLPNGGQMTTGNNFTPSEMAQMLKYSKCMRAHGVLNFPDPSSTGMGDMSGVDPNSPQFTAADEACHSLMPQLGGSGPVSGPPAGS